MSVAGVLLKSSEHGYHVSNGYHLMDEEIVFPLFVRALSALLEETEGIIIHRDGKGYVVYRADGQLHVIEDDDYLNYQDLNLTWMHDEPVGNA